MNKNKIKKAISLSIILSFFMLLGNNSFAKEYNIRYSDKNNKVQEAVLESNSLLKYKSNINAFYSKKLKTFLEFNQRKVNTYIKIINNVNF